MSEAISVKEVGEEILTELKSHNQKIWNVVSFKMIYGMISKNQNSDKVVRDYRRERWNKALVKVNGDKKKAYKLISSEDFY